MPHFSGLFARFKHKHECFVETGTYLGSGVIQALKDGYWRIITCEIQKDLIDKAIKNVANSKLVTKKHEITFLNCDSLEMLKVEKQLNISIPTKSLYWIDSHYSGGITGGEGKADPISEELELLSKRDIVGSTILIDDARGQEDYIAGLIQKYFNRLPTWIADNYSEKDIAVVEL